MCGIQLVQVKRRKRRFSKGGKKEEMGNQWPPPSTLGSELAAKIQIHTHIQVMKANTHAYAMHIMHILIKIVEVHTE